VLNVVLVLVWGWNRFSPNFDGVAFVSHYIELPIMLLRYVGWKLWKRTSIVELSDMDLETDMYEAQPGEMDNEVGQGWRGKMQMIIRWLF